MILHQDQTCLESHCGQCKWPQNCCQLHIRVAINRSNEHHIDIILVKPDMFFIWITFVLFIPNKNPPWYTILMKTIIKYPSLYSTNSEKPLNLFLPLLRIELTSSTCHSTLRTSTQSWLFRRKTMAERLRWVLPKYNDGSPSWRRMGTIATTTSVTSMAYALLELLVFFFVNRSPTPSHSASPWSPPPCMFFLP
jgi:hypothetical protein